MKIHVIDQEFLGTKIAIASFLLEAPEGYILIESGPATTQDTLIKKIKELGVEPEEIGHVLITHIHLDHSGGAGYWAQRGAKIYVHPKGARHLINPERLLASAARIYLDRMEELWGTTLPIPADSVVEMEEGSYQIAGLEIQALETPGHATHHLAFRVGDIIFTGDVGACRMPGSDFISVPGPPPEFNLELWLESLAKMKALKPETLFLTHFGEVADAMSHLEGLEFRLRDCVEFVRVNLELEPQELSIAYQNWDREQAEGAGVPVEIYNSYEKANPSFMSSQGIARYLRKKRDE